MKSVVAAVPHFNGTAGLPPLLESISNQGYDDIVILDDASRRDEQYAAAAIAESYDAQFIAGTENRGLAGNRNRLHQSKRWRGTYVHFLDADTTVTSTDTAARVRDLLDTPSVGMGGGLIRDDSGTPLAWNYGPSFTAKALIGSHAQMAVAELARRAPERAAAWRERLGFLLRAWPDTTDPQPRQTFYVAEANLCIAEKTLADTGGFPPVRTHDVQGLAIEIARRGLSVLFEPDIAVTHHTNKRTSNQNNRALGATMYLLKHYGLWRYLTGGDMSI